MDAGKIDNLQRQFNFSLGKTSKRADICKSPNGTDVLRMSYEQHQNMGIHSKKQHRFAVRTKSLVENANRSSV